MNPTDSTGLRITELASALEQATPHRHTGKLTTVSGVVVRAAVMGVRIGELCEIRSPHRPTPVLAEVVGFERGEVLLIPLGDIRAISPDSEVVPTGRVLEVPCGPELTGRVLNALGQPIDDGPSLSGVPTRAVEAEPPNPLTRRRIRDRQALRTGIRVIDAVLTVGHGQRVGIFSAAGVGKSALLGMLARNVEVDAVVIALIGERGREVREFIEDNLTAEGLAKSVVVVSTSDQSPLLRVKAAYVATTLAESLREQGQRVVLLMDSITRFARALREVGLAAGEPPSRQGYPPSVFSALPRLLERTGNDEHGSITAFYTVLVEGDDMSEPVADEVLSLLDGHIVLSRSIAARGRYPAVDLLFPSVSRVMDQIVTSPHRAAARKLIEVLATYEAKRDLIALGAYQRGADPNVDYAIDKVQEIEAFLQQEIDAATPFDETVARLTALFDL